jgi:cellobiose phosphorylase
MTGSAADAAVLSDAGELKNDHGLTALSTQSGTLERLEVDGCSVLLYPASALADGPAGLWLRRRTSTGVVPIPLLGQTSATRCLADGLGRSDRHGESGDLAFSVSLRLSGQRAAWFWHVAVINRGTEPVVLDLVHAQDVALAPLGAVRNNEYYVSQYLDLSPVEVPEHGVALGVRQNMPGPTPWLLVGCLGRADRWATDAIQLTGRGRGEGAPWPALASDLPATRRQGEHSVAALQTEPTVLGPGATWTSGFYGLYLPDHPEATSAADVRHATTALADPAAIAPAVLMPPLSARAGDDHRSLFGTAEPLRCRPVIGEELDRLTGTDRLEPEYDGGELLSFFTADGVHVVTAAKQARVLRPHGHLLRSGSSLLPDEPSICATVWMDGTFCSQLTQGHVNLGTISSVRRSYLGLAPAHGLRLFVRTDQTRPWLLLGTPSAWSVALDECRWWYASELGLLQVSTRVRAESDVVEIRLLVQHGAAVEVLAAAHLPWLDPDGPPGTWVLEPDSLRIAAPDGGPTTELFPAASVHLGWTPGTAEPDDDGPLFLDSRSRGLPWVTLRTAALDSWRLTIAPALVKPEPDRPADPDFWPATARAVSVSAPETAAGRELGRIATALPWFTHDALIHYLSPRGLEQYSGGAWGTRDVCQGPLGLLLALGAHAELRSLVLRIFSAQHARGDWPQSFEFLPRHRSEAVLDAHGDVVYWPLLALGEYLAATGDDTILDERARTVGGTGEPTSITDHVRAALDHIDQTLIDQTSLPAYGAGDWNDSLQPVDPRLAARLVSTWTAVLQAHTLSTLGVELRRHERTRRLADRAERTAAATERDLRRVLLVDGVLAGYGLFPEPTLHGTGELGPVEPLIHPRDRRTGLSYSILAMIHAVSGELLTPGEAAQQLRLVRDHLLGPDGARLFDRPVGYAGGPMRLFRRAEASAFFGREIGVMYMHAHLRYAEALAKVGDGPALLEAMALAQPVGATDRVPSAQPRQSTSYYSSSDAAFADRYAARDGYRGIFDQTVPLEGGWRVYSSGPGLFLSLLVHRLLGVRVRGPEVHLDPVLDPGLNGLEVRLPLLGARRTVRYVIGRRGHGVVSVRVGGVELTTVRLANPYRSAGVSVSAADLGSAYADPGAVLELWTG